MDRGSSHDLQAGSLRNSRLATCATSKGVCTSLAKRVTVQIDKVDDKVSDEVGKKSCAEDLRCCATTKGVCTIKAFR